MKIPVTTLVVSSKNSPEYTKKFIENYLKRLEDQKDKLKIFQELAPAGFRVIEVYGTSDKDMELDIESEEDIILFRETTQILLKNKGLESVYAKYFKRYWFDKLIDQLLIRGFVQSKISISMGLKSRMYLSCKLDYDQLTLSIAEYWNNVTGNKKLKELKERERLAKKQFHALITAP